MIKSDIIIFATVSQYPKALYFYYLQHCRIDNKITLMKNNTYIQLIKRLEDDGENITPIRQKIISILCTEVKPISSREILNKMTEEGVSVHRATVYRDIDFCEKRGLINSYMFKDKPVVFYEIAGEHHHHVICDVCGEIQIIFPNKIEKSIKDFEKDFLKSNNFKINSHRIKFYGQCDKCQ